MPKALLTALVRAVELTEPRVCGCGYVIQHIGVCDLQPQPRDGDFSVCPQCLTIYQVHAVNEFTLEPAAQRDIPVHYLELRDRMLKTLVTVEPAAADKYMQVVAMRRS